MAIETITWKAPNGTTYPFDGSGNYLALIGEQGNYAPPVVLLDQRTPLQPGTNIRFQDIQPRILTYPLAVTAASETALRTAIRTLVAMFMTTSAATPGTLIATAPDGSQRQITCWYYDGLEGDGSERNRGPGNILFPLQLEAAQPFWQDTSPTTGPLYTGPFGTPQTPTIVISSDYLNWPTITIHGPATAIQIQNNPAPDGTTPFEILTGLTMASTDVLVINTLKGTVILNGVTNLIGNLSLASIFWPLEPGTNQLYLSLAGSTASTTIQFVYTNNWWSC